MSILTKKQTKTFTAEFSENGQRFKIVANVRHDDECGNGHNTFSITGDLYKVVADVPHWQSGGCIHDQIAQHIPELAPFIKWHLCSTDGPLHYAANTCYHVLAHGATHAWIYYTWQSDPLNIADSKEKLLAYAKADIARRTEGQPGYRVLWDEKTVKVANLDYARSSAIWPDATDDELKAPDLAAKLAARLPALMIEFRAAVESLGFIY